jgi:hypothetical protein
VPGVLKERVGFAELISDAGAVGARKSRYAADCHLPVTEPEPTPTVENRVTSENPPRPGGRKIGRALLRTLMTLLAVLWTLALVRDWILPDSPDQLSARFETRLATHMPAYAVLEEYDPEAHRRIGEAMRTALARGETPDQVAFAGGRALGEVVDRYLPDTSREAVTLYAQTLVRSLEVIAARDARLCYDVLYRPDRINPERLESLVSEAMTLELMRAQGRVIEDALTAPAEDVSAKRTERLLDEVRLALEGAYGPDAVLLWEGESGHREAGHSRVCRMTISMFEVALDMEDDSRAIVLKHLLSP